MRSPRHRRPTQPCERRQQERPRCHRATRLGRNSILRRPLSTTTTPRGGSPCPLPHAPLRAVPLSLCPCQLATALLGALCASAPLVRPQLDTRLVRYPLSQRSATSAPCLLSRPGSH